MPQMAQIFGSCSCDFKDLSRAGLENVNFLLRTRGLVRILNVPPTETILLQIAANLGGIEHDYPEALVGPKVMPIKYDPKKIAIQTSDRPAYFNNEKFDAHTDLTFIDFPPRRLLTLCIQPDPSGQGASVFADGSQAFRQLSRAHQETLKEPIFGFKNAPNTGEGICHDKPIYGPCGSNEMIRFRYDGLIIPNRAISAVDAFRTNLEQLCLEWVLKPTELVIVDNHRWLHGRRWYPPDSSRWLCRAYCDWPPVESGENLRLPARGVLEGDCRLPLHGD